jgi:hypothetical protein
MSVIVKAPQTKDFAPAPQGLHRAVCVDVLDTWTEERPQEYGGGLVEKTRLVWEIDEAMEDGRRFLVSQFYTASLHEKAKLRQHLEAWRGRAFTEEELNGFDLENVIGVPCQLQVIHHTTKAGKTYANVQAVVPPSKGAERFKPSGEYVRMKDRKDEDQHTQDDDGYYVDDSVPF